MRVAIVVAVAVVGCGPAKPKVAAEIPAHVTNFQVRPRAHELRFAWTQPEAKVDHYELRRGNTIVDLAVIRRHFKGTFMICNEYDQAKGEAAIASGKADLVAFGKLFIANPDLPRRFAENKPLNPWDDSTFYTPGEKGYTDYPSLTSPAPSDAVRTTLSANAKPA